MHLAEADTKVVSIKEGVKTKFASSDKKENILKAYAFNAKQTSEVNDPADYRRTLESSDSKKGEILMHEGASLSYVLYIMDIKDGKDINGKLTSLMEKKRQEKISKLNEEHQLKIQARIKVTEERK